MGSHLLLPIKIGAMEVKIVSPFLAWAQTSRIQTVWSKSGRLLNCSRLLVLRLSLKAADNAATIFCFHLCRGFLLS